MNKNKQYPDTLYRFVDTELALNEHIKGHLIFKQPQYFSQIEAGNSRLDKLEGTGSAHIKSGNYKFHDIDDIYPALRLQAAYILCMTEDSKVEKFGRFGMSINTEILISHLKKNLPRWNIQLRSIIYNKEYEINEEPDNKKWIERKFFSKPSTKAEEKEWRILLLSPPLAQNTNMNFDETFKVNIPKTSNTFKKF